MKNIIILSSLILLIACKTEKSDQSVNLITELDSVSYSLGVNIGENIKKQFEDINLDNFEAGIKDVLEKELEAKISDNQAQAIINSYFSKKQQNESESVIEQGVDYLRENAKREGVTTLESGLQYEVISNGKNGPKPTINDQVTVNYHGTLINGNIFDSSISTGQPATFPIGQVIPGWVEGIQLMSVGDKYKFYIPSDLAYGANPPSNNIGVNETLIFEVELLKIN